MALAYLLSPLLLRFNVLRQFCRQLVSCFLGRHSSPRFRFAVVICAYNVEAFIARCIKSVARQLGGHEWSCYITNDASDDRTAELIAFVINGLDPALRQRFYVFHNETNKGALHNFYHAFVRVNSERMRRSGDACNTIICMLDGDDALLDPYCFDHLCEAYERNACLLTYGSFLEYPSFSDGFTQRLADRIHAAGSYRSGPWHSSHLKTFASRLFEYIPLSYLIDPLTHDFFMYASDLAIMYSLLELVRDKSLHLARPLYLYNRLNPINEDKVDRFSQIRCASLIQALPPLDPLSDTELKKHFKLFICNDMLAVGP